MKTLKKLVLVTTVAISSSAFALESLDEKALGETTGQDGITIALGGSGGVIVGADVVIHDRGGFEDGVITNLTRNDNAAPNVGIGLTSTITPDTTNGKKNNADGAILFQGFAIKSATNGKINIVVDADAGNVVSGNNQPVLNLNIGLPSDLVVETGAIYVAKSNGINAAASGQYDNATKAKILDNIIVGLGGAKMNIQLGNQPQGALIKLAGSIQDSTYGGLDIGNLNILQGDQAVAANGGIGIGHLNIKTAGEAGDSTGKWTLNANINATSNGLEISGLGSADIRLTDVKLGNLNTGNTTKTLGNMALLGLALPTVSITGH